MATMFGTDSVCPANTRLSNGYDLFSWVMRKRGFPAFWGRSITGENTITKEEVNFLRKKKCKIALYLDDLTETGVAGINGTEDGVRAVEAAKKIGVPEGQGIAIFVVLGENWGINHNWLLSFASAINGNGFLPGFLGNTDSSKNFSFNRQCGHFLRATKDMENFAAVFGATEPKTEKEAVVWEPYCPSDLEKDKIALWQNGTITCDGISANTTYAHDESVLSCMW